MTPIIFGICLLCVCGYFWFQIVAFQIVTDAHREIAYSQEIAAYIRGENDEWHATTLKFSAKGWSEKRTNRPKELCFWVADDISIDEPVSITPLYFYMTTDYVFTDLATWNWVDEIDEISKSIKYK